MGLFSFISSFAGAAAQKKASRKADAALIEQLERGVAEQGRQYDLTREDFQPYTAAGASAIGGMGDLTGLNGGEDWQLAISELERSSYFQCLFRIGDVALI